jgi:hypothetical protein
MTHLCRGFKNELRLSASQRSGEIASELLDEIDRDTCVHASLAVQKYCCVIEGHNRAMPYIGMQIEPACAVAPKRHKLVWRHIVSRQRQRHHETVPAERIEKLAAVRMIVCSPNQGAFAYLVRRTGRCLLRPGISSRKGSCRLPRCFARRAFRLSSKIRRAPPLLPLDCRNWHRWDASLGPASERSRSGMSSGHRQGSHSPEESRPWRSRVELHASGVRPSSADKRSATARYPWFFRPCWPMVIMHSSGMRHCRFPGDRGRLLPQRPVAVLSIAAGGLLV